MRESVVGVVCCALVGACATEENNLCENPVGLYRATVTWKTPTCSTPATTVQFLITERESYDLDWTIEINPWKAKGRLEAVSGPAGCVELQFRASVDSGGSTSESFDGWVFTLDGELPTGSLGGGGFRNVITTPPCQGQFQLDYVVKEAD